MGTKDQANLFDIAIPRHNTLSTPSMNATTWILVFASSMITYCALAGLCIARSLKIL